MPAAWWSKAAGGPQALSAEAERRVARLDAKALASIAAALSYPE